MLYSARARAAGIFAGFSGARALLGVPALPVHERLLGGKKVVCSAVVRLPAAP